MKILTKILNLLFKKTNMKNTGTVKWFNPTKGYGFIALENGSKDVFVHISVVQEAGLDNLDDNQKIEFEIVEEKGRQSAINLKLID
ncbi:MAG: CspA family cold shock protein [Candidatus Midichloriaceae bacterium]|jgi:CspA family cold shock protein